GFAGRYSPTNCGCCTGKLTNASAAVRPSGPGAAAASPSISARATASACAPDFQISSPNTAIGRCASIRYFASPSAASLDGRGRASTVNAAAGQISALRFGVSRAPRAKHTYTGPPGAVDAILNARRANTGIDGGFLTSHEIFVNCRLIS